MRWYGISMSPPLYWKWNLVDKNCVQWEGRDQEEERKKRPRRGEKVIVVRSKIDVRKYGCSSAIVNIKDKYKK